LALEQERVAREAAQKSLEGRNTEFLKLEGELMVLSITSASQELALQEQGETLKGLEQAVEAGRRALEVEKQVEGKLLFVSCFADFPLEGSPPFLIPVRERFRVRSQSVRRRCPGRPRLVVVGSSFWRKIASTQRQWRFTWRRCAGPSSG
jgi:hypothetical protein